MPTRRAKLFPTPDDAETAFYEAFERRDLAAMMTVWEESDDVVCVHPRGVRLTGFDAVRESWAQIFAGGGGAMRVRATEVRRFDGNSVAVHTLVEILAAPGSTNPSATQSVCATNVFELTDGGWRMVLHHATPMAEPERERPRGGREDDTPPPTRTLH
jgi:uncharacterized protein (TIGR02246 family)